MNHRCAALFLAAAAPALLAEQAAKNVILFLGDAGGIPTLNAASIHEYGAARRLFVQRMPHIALSETSSADGWVTDSAAGMTAIVTGKKTGNGVISQSAAAVRGRRDGEPLKTILELAEERGLATGVVSNSSVLSATPAACYAHVNDRKDLTAVFRWLLNPRSGDGVDVVIGAGLADVTAAAPKAGMDGASALRRAGLGWYESLDSVPGGARRAAVLLGSEDFDLNAATQRAIDILSRNPNGFFLMVESDLHTENIVRGLERAAALDNTVRRTVERLAATDTLILFTADHSYDFRMHDGRKGAPLFQDSEQAAAANEPKSVRFLNLRRDDDHTGEDVLVAAQGPGAERVRGMLSNTDLFDIMVAAYGWKGPASKAAAPDNRGALAGLQGPARVRAVEAMARRSDASTLDLLLQLAASEPDAAVRKAIVDRLGRQSENAAIIGMLQTRAVSDPDPAVSLLALERLKTNQARQLGKLFEKRIESARSANDTPSLTRLTAEHQRWASYAKGATLPGFLQEPPPVFEAIPARNSVRVLAFSDFGTGGADMKKTAAAVAVYHRLHPFDLGVTLGDNVLSNGVTGTADPRWKQIWEDLYDPLGIPIFATTGNHDWGYADSPAAEILYSLTSRTWRMPALYYSYTAGPVQFFALATQAMSQTQLAWLQRELERSTARWKIVYGHHPIYSDGSHGDTEGLADTLLPVLNGRAHLYLVGHEHTPQHLKPAGDVHLMITPAAGQGTRPASTGPRTLYSGSYHGFSVIDAHPETLTFRFVDADGSTQYETTLN